MTTTTLPENYGYILLDTPEKQKAAEPKRKTDQLLLIGNPWTYRGEIPKDTEGFRPTNTYRRPVDVGEGWELVTEGFVNFTDESTTDGINWYRTYLTYLCNNSTPEKLLKAYPEILAVRRKQVQQEQIKCKQTRRFISVSSNDACGCADNQDAINNARACAQRNGHTFYACEVIEEINYDPIEKSRKEWLDKMYCANPIDAFRAGWEAAKKEDSK